MAYSTAASRGAIQACGRPDTSSCSTSMPQAYPNPRRRLKSGAARRRAAARRVRAQPLENAWRAAADDGKIERSFDCFRSSRLPRMPAHPTTRRKRRDRPAPAQGPADARRDPRRRARPGLADGAGGPVDRRAGRGDRSMSKSGVFAHFGSREELQISVIREYHARFEDEVFFPAMRERRGLPRLRALFERWVRRVSVELDSGCIYISGAVEFDDRPGPVRDALVGMVRDLAGGAGARDPARHRDRRTARRHRRAADAVRDARPDPGAAPRRAFPAHARLAGPRAPRRSSVSSTAASHRRRSARARRVVPQVHPLDRPFHRES